MHVPMAAKKYRPIIVVVLLGCVSVGVFRYVSVLRSRRAGWVLQRTDTRPKDFPPILVPQRYKRFQ